MKRKIVRINKNINKNKGKARRARTPYPESLWEEVKWKWIRGGITFKYLSIQYNIPCAVIHNKSSKDGWKEQQEEFFKEGHKKIREQMVKMFVEVGMPPHRLIELICKGAEETTKLQNVKSEPIEWKRKVKGKLVPGKPFVLDQTIEVVDNETTFRYRELAVKLLDMYPAPKAALKINGNGNSSKKFNITFEEAK